MHFYERKTQFQSIGTLALQNFTKKEYLPIWLYVNRLHTFYDFVKLNY
jgi:hypothetical protein